MINNSKGNDMNNSILHDWVVELDLKDQAHLIPVLRGCDIEDDRLKLVTKMLRFLIGKNFVKKTKYSDDNILNINKFVEILIYSRSISNHWVEHIVLAIKIIAEKHPDAYIKYYYNQIIKEYSIAPILEPFIYRLYKERDELSIKITKLKTWIDNNETEVYSDQREQLLLMQRYLEIVIKRLKDYFNKNNLKHDNIGNHVS